MRLNEALVASLTAWAVPSIPTTGVPATHLPAGFTTRRSVLVALPAAAALLPSLAASAATEAPALTPATLAYIEPYLTDLTAARRGLAEVRTLLELNEDRGFEAVRVTIRKPPLSGIRKACSKVIKELPLDSTVLKSKTALYDSIKVKLEAIDGGCRPGLDKRPDLLGMVAQLEADLDAFGDGLFAVVTSE
jgi:hypothetical protein